MLVRVTVHWSRLVNLLVLRRWLVNNSSWAGNWNGSSLISRHKTPLFISNQYWCLCLIFVDDRAIKHVVVRNDLVLLLVNSMLSCTDCADDNRSLVSSVVMPLVCILLPWCIIDWSSSVSSIISRAHHRLVFLYVHLDVLVVLLGRRLWRRSSGSLRTHASRPWLIERDVGSLSPRWILLCACNLILWSDWSTLRPWPRLEDLLILLRLLRSYWSDLLARYSLCLQRYDPGRLLSIYSSWSNVWRLCTCN